METKTESVITPPKNYAPVDNTTEPRNSRAAVTIGMDDVPWLDEETINQVLSSTPLHLRDAVKNGTPSLGSGSIYPIPLDDVVLSQEDAQRLLPFPQHWKRIYGMDVGWNKTAVEFVIRDPESETYYVYDEYYMGKMEPEIHAARISSKSKSWIPGAIDPASRGRSQVDGQQLIQIYRKLGLKVREADNEVEAGIYKIWSLLAGGKLKFFPQTFGLQQEYLLYRRDEQGKIVKDHDHALDALRYAINTFHMAQQAPITNTVSAPRRRYNV